MLASLKDALDADKGHSEEDRKIREDYLSQRLLSQKQDQCSACDGSALLE